LRGAPWIPALLTLATGCVIQPDRPAGREVSDPRAEAMVDPAYYAASVALAEHHPWRAESLLTPALADSARRTAWVLLLAAEAAAETERWEHVDSLLESASYVYEPRAEVPARLLQARGALERGQSRRALTFARIADSLTRKGEEQGRALVFVARAQERLGARDSARAAYTKAAAGLKPVHDWLMLRAAALTRDSGGRAKLYDRLRTPVARDRAPYAEAQLLERNGRPRSAIALYEKAGAPVNAMRLRAAVASGLVERDRARRELIAYVQSNTGTMDARFAIELLDAGRYRLTPDEEILVARSAAEHGPLSRARASLDRAFAQRPPTPDERMFQISVLVESGPASRRQAEQILARIKKPAPHAGRAALERAKLMRRRGASASARTALREVVRAYPDDTIAGAGALQLLAEMATDEKRDLAAREAYLSLARKYPTTPYAPRARYEAAILAIAARQNKAAAAELDSLVDLYPDTPDLTAALYWSGRAHAAYRDSAGARRRWEAAMTEEPMSYYSAIAARRLKVEPWTPDDSPEIFATITGIDDALVRIDLLERLGMDLEARLELDGLAASADSSVERMLAVANVFRRRGNMRRAAELGRRAIALGSKDARAYRFIYPIDEERLIAAEAAKRKVDPALIAAVIRHESSFEPRATSPVGARGLMQIMPRVGRALARAERITPWTPGLLYDPDINIRLGVVHLRSFTRHYSHPAMALAAYNAGQSRVTRWSSRPGGKDPEIFVERIRFAETKGYVRNILRSRDMYAVLYDWERIGLIN
jgi:TolA-binding protein